MPSKSNIILAIESSCDETSASVIRNGIVCSNSISTQPIHSIYGGVVPELASRAHEKNIIPVVEDALIRSNVNKLELDAIAFTKGPGLLGSLLVGCSFAKALALTLNVPLIGVNHMEAHIFAHFIDDPKPEFPFLCLTVSGGHTQIVLVEDFGKLTILGETMDDAVGEAFDKTAKILGLPYPGGPVLDKLAQDGNPAKYKFPIPEIGNFDFSFSGIKTSILYFLQRETTKNENFVAENLKDICASIQSTLIDILMRKIIKAAKAFQINQIAIAGGVAANSELRRRIKEDGNKLSWKTFIPKFEYCTDNAAMIAITAHYKFKSQLFENQSVVPNARLELN